jgi:hypothetical protein
VLKAIGKNCPACGSLTACTGDENDAVLSKRCETCGTTVTVDNHRVEIQGVAGHALAQPVWVKVAGDTEVAEPGSVTTQDAVASPAPGEFFMRPQPPPEPNSSFKPAGTDALGNAVVESGSAPAIVPAPPDALQPALHPDAKVAEATSPAPAAPAADPWSTQFAEHVPSTGTFDVGGGQQVVAHEGAGAVTDAEKPG